MFKRDYGATTGFSTQISILRADAELSGSGNAFRADDDHGISRLGQWEGTRADMELLSPDHLVIRYAAKSRLFEHYGEVSGVTITYQAVQG